MLATVRTSDRLQGGSRPEPAGDDAKARELRLAKEVKVHLTNILISVTDRIFGQCCRHALALNQRSAL